jgi:hypothetical protein
MSQLAWSVGQPSGAVMLLLGVDARAVHAGQLLDHMLQLAEAAGVAIASGINVSACEVGCLSVCGCGLPEPNLLTILMRRTTSPLIGLCFGRGRSATN